MTMTNNIVLKPFNYDNKQKCEDEYAVLCQRLNFKNIYCTLLTNFIVLDLYLR